MKWTERVIFRNIQHVPRVWGVTYPKLFAAIGFGLLVTTAAFGFSSGAPTLVKVLIIGFGIVLTSAFYGICFWLEYQEALDRDQPFLKNEMNSQSMSQQTIHIEGNRNALERPDTKP